MTGLLGAGQAEAKPAVEVNLASTTAWTFRPQGEEGQGKSLPVPAGRWPLNGFSTVTAPTYERRIEVPRLAGRLDEAALVVRKELFLGEPITAGGQAEQQSAACDERRSALPGPIGA